MPLVVNSLWRGDWVQKNNENADIDCELCFQALECQFLHANVFAIDTPYTELRKRGEVPAIDASRIGVPR